MLQTSFTGSGSKSSSQPGHLRLGGDASASASALAAGGGISR
jgi:hypothetical protein